MFTRPTPPVAAVPPEFPEAPVAAAARAKRPRAWSLSNWPVRWKVLAIVLVPLLLATALGALRVKDAMTNSAGLRLAAARTDVLPAITQYMSALDVALLAPSTGGDVEGTKKNFQARKDELQTRLAITDVIPDVRSGVNILLNGGQALLDKVLDDSIGVRDRVTTYAPILLTAEDVINASVRVDDEQIRAQAQAGNSGDSRRRPSRAATAHVDDHAGGHRTVDAVRDESGARRQLDGSQDAATATGKPHGDPVRSGQCAGRQCGIAAFDADHRRDRRTGHQARDVIGDKVSAGPGD